MPAFWQPLFTVITTSPLLSALGNASLIGACYVLCVFLLFRLFARIPLRVQVWGWRLVYLRLLCLLFSVQWGLPLLPTSPHLTPSTKRSFVWPPLRSREGEDPMERISRTGPTLPKMLSPKASLPLTSPPRRNEGSSAPLPLDKGEGRVGVLLASLYALGVLWCLVRIARAAWRLRGIVRRALPPTDPAWNQLVQAAERLHLRKIPQLRISAEIGGPLCTSGMILLPQNATYTEAELRSVLAHEMAHLKHGDLWGEWFGLVTQTLFFFHPFVLLARREERIAREAAADAVAVTVLKTSPFDYGKTLLAVVEQQLPLTRALPGAIGIGETGRSLERRLHALKEFRPAPPTRRQMLFTGSLSVFLCLLLLPWQLTHAQSTSGRSSTNGDVGYITGRLVAEDGTPVTKAALIPFDVTKNNHRGTHLVLDRARTTTVASDGTFRVPLPANKPYGIRAEVNGYIFPLYNMDGGFLILPRKPAAPQSFPTLQPGETNDVGTITLRRADGLVQGRILDHTGGPVEGYIVAVYSGKNGIETTTNQKGEFTLKNFVSGPGMQLSVYQGEILSGRNPERPDFLYRVAVTSGTRNLTITLPEPKRVFAGTVSVPGGQSVPEATVDLEQNIRTARMATTGWNKRITLDKSGHFVFVNIPPGDYTVRMAQVGGNGTTYRPYPDLQRSFQTQPASTSVDYPFTWRPGIPVRGRVVDQKTNKPLSGINVFAYTMGGTPSGISFSQNGTTDANGDFALALPPGKARLLVQSQNPPTLVSREIRDTVVKAGDAARLTIPVHAYSAENIPRLTFVDSNKKPVTGMNVMVYGDDPHAGNYRLTTDVQGSVNLQYQRSGTFRASKGNVAYSGHFTLDADDTLRVTTPLGTQVTSRGQATLSPVVAAPAMITGVVIAKDGTPLPNAIIHVYETDPVNGYGRDSHTGTTNKEGRFGIGVPLDGKYSVSVRAEGYSQVSVTRKNDFVPTRQGEQWDTGSVTLIPAPGTITGQVLSADGAPLKDLCVQVMGDNTYISATQIDANGRFTLKNIVPCETLRMEIFKGYVEDSGGAARQSNDVWTRIGVEAGMKNVKIILRKADIGKTLPIQ